MLGMSIFDFADFITSSFGLPLGALFISLFAGYILSQSELNKELMMNNLLVTTWRIIVRFAAPIAIIIVFVQGVIKVIL
jgi:NSS family neurotransmitter:Na+ symporter